MLKQFNKQVRKYAERSLIRLDADLPSPSSRLLFTICIPMRNEQEPSQVLEDLYKQDLDRELFEVIVLVNEVAGAGAALQETGRASYNKLIQFKRSSQEPNLHVLFVNDMPVKKGGVGLARKTAMDTAWLRYIDSKKENGLIVCLDADCRVSSTYLSQLKELSSNAPDIHAFSFEFHHDLSQHPKNRKAIIEYELHLRLFRELLLVAGHPHSQYTVGSSMACTVLGYSAMGGMNTRKAGEDFYFLQKFIRSGYHSFYPEIVVYPSNRDSDRVPFGTGRAMISRRKDESILTYNIGSYQIIQDFISLSKAYLRNNKSKGTFPSELEDFLPQKQWEDVLINIKGQTTSEELYDKKFFEWFDAFKAMKMLHFLRDNFSHLRNQPVFDVAKYYLSRSEDRTSVHPGDLSEGINRIKELTEKLKGE